MLILVSEDMLFEDQKFIFNKLKNEFTIANKERDGKAPDGRENGTDR